MNFEYQAFAPGPNLSWAGKKTTVDGRNICKMPPVPAPRAPVRMVSAPPVKKVVKEAKPSTERQTKQPDMYRLFIYNDPFNKRERVVDVLLKTCQGLSFSRAYAAMQEAHENGRGLVIVVFQEIAEHYCATINLGKTTTSSASAVAPSLSHRFVSRCADLPTANVPLCIV